MKNKEFVIISLVISLLLINGIFALDTQNTNRLSFGHILVVKTITTDPLELVPGNDGKLRVKLINNGDLAAKDIRVKLTLPDEISFINDVSEKKMSEIKPDQEVEFNFSIITLPKTTEGVYKAFLSVDYVNYVGEERDDNYSVGIVVKSSPKIFAQIDKTDIYRGKNTGYISLLFTNNDLANIRFLTLEIGESNDYEVISTNKKYIGDLDSNDYQSATFTMNFKDDVKETKIPVKVTYKDSLNKDYTENLEIPFKIRTAKELGIKDNGYYWLIFVLLIIVIAVLYIYRKSIFKSRYE